MKKVQTEQDAVSTQVETVDFKSHRNYNEANCTDIFRQVPVGCPTPEKPAVTSSGPVGAMHTVPASAQASPAEVKVRANKVRDL